MRRVAPWELWIGNRGDVRDPAAVARAGIRAVVDLSLECPPLSIPREMVVCRFPLNDGGGNPRPIVAAAVSTVAELMRTRVPTLVLCSAGMSRSPAIVAGAMARVQKRPPGECLGDVTFGAPADVSAGLWGQVLETVALKEPNWGAQ